MSASAPARARVLVLSTEEVGHRMAGPAIRSLELARALAGRCAVTIAAPPGSRVEDERLGLEVVERTDHRRALALARRHDVVVVQHPPPQLLLALAREPVRIVADLYTPLPLEALEATRGLPAAEARRVRRLAARLTLAALTAADLVLCASDRQRDLWIGALCGQDLIDPELYAADPTLRSLVAVVPFGVPAEPPAAGGPPVVRGVRPGIGAEDRLLVWGGGVWDWLDALTPIRAVERLRERRGDVHLLFLGLTRPTEGSTAGMTAADDAVALARERGLLGRCVHVNEDWVPYAERGRWLAEADVGVTAHRDHAETRYAFRTRVLDYLWAGLPVVGTRGDVLTDRVGGGVAPQDDRAFAEALERVLDPGPGREAAMARSRALAEQLTWERVAEPLVAFCVEHAARPRRRREMRRLAGVTLAQYPSTLANTYRVDGGGAAVRRVARNAGRLIGVGS